MTLNEARKLLPVYSDGELDAERSTALERFLSESPALRGELESWRSLRQALNRAISHEQASEALRRSITAAIADTRSDRIHFRPLRWAGGLTAAAAAVAVIFFLTQPRMVTAGPTEVAADRFLEIHRNCAIIHRHNGAGIDVSDLNKARTQLAGMSSVTVLIPDLQDQGFSLAGACRCFKCDDLKALHVFYRREQPAPAVVSIFSIDRKVQVKNCRCERCVCAAGICREYETVQDNDLIVYKWDEANSSYAICGGLPADELRHLANVVTLAKFQTALDALASASISEREP